MLAEPLPSADYIGRRDGGERLRGRPASEPVEVVRNDALDLGLLEHDLAHEDRIRVARVPPGEISTSLREPLEQQPLHACEGTRDTERRQA